MTDAHESASAGSIPERVQRVLGMVFNLDPSSIGPETSIDTVEDWDSLQQLTVVLSLEAEFDLHFDDEETASLVSYPLIVEILKEHLGSAADAGAAADG